MVGAVVELVEVSVLRAGFCEVVPLRPPVIVCHPVAVGLTSVQAWLNQWLVPSHVLLVITASMYWGPGPSPGLRVSSPGGPASTCLTTATIRDAALGVNATPLLF